MEISQIKMEINKYEMPTIFPMDEIQVLINKKFNIDPDRLTTA